MVSIDLKIDFEEISNTSVCDIQSLVDKHLNRDPKFYGLLYSECNTLKNSLLDCNSVKTISSFVIKVAYYFNLILIKKLVDINESKMPSYA